MFEIYTPIIIFNNIHVSYCFFLFRTDCSLFTHVISLAPNKIPVAITTARYLLLFLHLSAASASLLHAPPSSSLHPSQRLNSILPLACHGYWHAFCLSSSSLFLISARWWAPPGGVCGSPIDFFFQRACLLEGDKNDFFLWHFSVSCSDPKICLMVPWWDSSWTNSI